MAKQKPPAFLFYYRDFLHAVRYWDDTQAMTYLRLLCDQADAENGRITPDIFNLLAKDEYVRGKFAEDENGFYNERMEGIINDRKARSRAVLPPAVLGGLISSMKLSQKQKKLIKSDFNTNDFLHLKTEKEVKQSVKIWLTNRLTIYEDENEDEDRSKNIEEEKERGIITGEPAYKLFYREQWELSKAHELGSKYRFIVEYLMNTKENIIGEPGLHILKLKKQLTFEEFVKLHEFVEKRATTIKSMLDSWLNNPQYSKGKISVYANLRTWANKEPIQGTNHSGDKSPLLQTKIGKA